MVEEKLEGSEVRESRSEDVTDIQGEARSGWTVQMDVLKDFSSKASTVGFLKWAKVHPFQDQCLRGRQKLWVWDLNEDEIQKDV